jgi:hypothetical protein
MKRSDIIVQVLIKSNLTTSEHEARNQLLQAFQKDFPEKNFEEWNSPVGEKLGKMIIRNVGVKTRETLSLPNLILDLEKILKNNSTDNKGDHF